MNSFRKKIIEHTSLINIINVIGFYIIGTSTIILLHMVKDIHISYLI